MMTALIPLDALKHFKNAIYFAMLIQILENDLALVDKLPIKLKRPYILLIEELKIIRAEYKETNAYLRQRKMILIDGKTSKFFTKYNFICNGYDDFRRYFNLRLRNRTEEFIEVYFDMVLL